MQGQDSNGARGRFTLRRRRVDPLTELAHARVVALTPMQPRPEGFSTAWEREMRNHLDDSRWLPYALLVGFWDARTLRRG